jgi:hypothetical protein
LHRRCAAGPHRGGPPFFYAERDAIAARRLETYNRSTMKYAPAIVALLSTCVAACRTTNPAPPPPAALLACSQLQDPGERVRCYDTQVAQMRAKATSPAPQAPASEPAASAPAVTPPASPAGPSAPASASAGTASGSAQAATAAVATPAATPPGSPALAAPPASPGNASASVATIPQPPSAAQFGEETLPDKLRPKVQESKHILLSRITTIDEVRPNVFVISLANGQIWRQQGTQRAQVAIFFRAGDDVRIEKATFGSYHMSSAQTGTKNWVVVTRIR